MNFCFLCDEYPPAVHGGIGRVIQTVARALVRRGHRVRVVGSYPSCPTLPEYEEDEGIGVYRLFTDHASFSCLFDLFRSRRSVFKRIASWIRQGDIDLVEAPDYKGAVAGWPTLPVPVIVRLHGAETLFSYLVDRRPSRVIYCLEKAGLRRADFVSSPSVYAANAIQTRFNIRPKRCHVVFNMSPVPDWKDRVRDQWKVVYSGTLAPHKGVIQLIRAWPLVQAACPMAELHLYGKDAGRGDGGSMVRFLQALLTPTCAPRVKFHGHVSRAELEPAIATARVCVFPSIVESFGLAPVEAMALGCPTIFSERCAGPEIIEHGQSGLLVDPLQADQIAAAIVRVLSDTRFAQSCGQSGWKRAWDLFSIDAVLPRLEAYYFSSISAFHGRQRSDPEYSL